mmetsp:Transcript_73581/g.238136  ORF Transcript_73581/g.238136 Transcript_73581/m.238136 type:complete len:407 (+) Transcript_73581:157-1377(+)
MQHAELTAQPGRWQVSTADAKRGQRQQASSPGRRGPRRRKGPDRRQLDPARRRGCWRLRRGGARRRAQRQAEEAAARADRLQGRQGSAAPAVVVGQIRHDRIPKRQHDLHVVWVGRRAHEAHEHLSADVVCSRWTPARQAPLLAVPPVEAVQLHVPPRGSVDPGAQLADLGLQGIAPNSSHPLAQLRHGKCWRLFCNRRLAARFEALLRAAASAARRPGELHEPLVRRRICRVGGPTAMQRLEPGTQGAGTTTHIGLHSGLPESTRSEEKLLAQAAPHMLGGLASDPLDAQCSEVRTLQAHVGCRGRCTQTSAAGSEQKVGIRLGQAERCQGAREVGLRQDRQQIGGVRHVVHRVLRAGQALQAREIRFVRTPREACSSVAGHAEGNLQELHGQRRWWHRMAAGNR